MSRERGRERQRQTERETDRQTDRQSMFMCLFERENGKGEWESCIENDENQRLLIVLTIQTCY